VASLGIRRGRPRALTKASHRSPASYRAEVAVHADAQKRIAETNSRTVVEGKVGAVAAAMTAGFDAVDGNQLVYRPAEGDKPEMMAKGPRAPTGEAWNRLKQAVMPAFSAVLRYAQAKARLLARELELDRREAALAEDAAQLVLAAARFAALQCRSQSTSTLARDALDVRQMASRIRQRVR
jgi:hypothetical protein